MFCAEIDTLRDAVLFAEGVCHGLRPPHGACTLPGFNEYLAHRFGNQEPRPWSRILLEQFGDLPLHEGCNVVHAILLDWKSTTQNLHTTSIPSPQDRDHEH